MTVLLRLFILFTLSVLVSSCVLPGAGDYQYTPPKSSMGQYCVKRCKTALNSCTQICALKDERCAVELKENATQSYSDYVSYRKAKKWRIRKSYKDFYRNASCEHSCNCVPAYNTCYRACGGTVY